MDIFALGFLLIVTGIVLGYGLIKANASAIVIGSFILILISALVYTEGYDIEYNPTTKTIITNISYDQNQNPTQLDQNVFRLNANNSATVKGISMAGMLIGLMTGLLGSGAALIRYNNWKSGGYK
jgi:hypothetical protein